MVDVLERLRAALESRYRIESELGSGGMATVYLAEDLKHHRKVAVKVLRPELAAALGTDRFLREIEIAANLNHPHILPLFDSGEANDFLYYVMPYVEGESLRDRLNHEQQLPVDEALRIAREVATGLGFAHERGVVHRDIKPENILLEAGLAVVADFGIARAVDAAGGTRLTETGMAMGTPEYMSPEQAAAGQDLDGRSDIYSLGCVLYEMLGGHPPFTGSTPREILARHTLDPVPSLAAARPSVTPVAVDTIEKALAKVPMDRFATAAEFAEALLRDAGDAGRRPQTLTTRQVTARARKLLPRLAWPALAVLAVGYAVWRPREPTSTADVRSATFAVPLPSGGELADNSGLAVAISPDGTRYVYVAATAAGTQLYVRPIDQIDAIPIAGTEGATHPFFSPDGQAIGFVADGRIKTVAVGGGRANTIVELESAFAGANWGANDTLLFAEERRGVSRVAASGGVPELVAAPAVGENSYWWPSQLPAGAILYAVLTGMDFDPTRIAVQSLDTGEREILLEEGNYPRYAPSGHIVYAGAANQTRVTSVHALRFDAARLRVVGDPVAVADSVVWTWSGRVAQFDFASDGSLVYVAARGSVGSDTLVWMDRSGKREVIDFLPANIYLGGVMISPDESRVGLSSQDDPMKTRLLDLDRRTVSVFTPGGSSDHFTI
jgi:serine/threonine-protein kinase